MARQYNRNHGKSLDSYLVLTNSIINQAISDEKYQLAVSDFFFTYEGSDLDKRLLKLLTFKRFKENLNAFSRTIEDIAAKPDFKSLSRNFRVIRILKALFTSDAEHIRLFIELRNCFEHSRLVGDYIKAGEMLELCKKNCGESLWFISNTILLLVMEGKSSQASDFSKLCISRTQSPYIKNLISNFQILFDSQDSNLPMKDTILSTVNEFNHAEFYEGSARTVLMFVTDPIVATCDYRYALESIGLFPLIDQYCYLLVLSQKFAVKKDLITSPYAVKLNELLKELHQEIPDKQICAILEYGSFKTNNLSILTKNIHENYESGNYLKVIEDFEANLDQSDSLFSNINIVAKSYAYLNIKPDNKSSILFELINLFRSLYSLDEPQNLVEDSIVSRIIKLHGFTQVSHLQAALYLALPNKYNFNDLFDACKLSFCTHGEINPRIYALVNAGMNSDTQVPSNLLRFGENGVESDRKNITNYRNLKLQICNLISRNENFSDIDKLFVHFMEINPLEKDYLELYVEFNLI